MDWSPSSPVASEDTFQDSNGAQPSFDYLYVQQQQQQQQQIQQHYMYTQQQQQQLGRFEWLDPSLTDHIAELCMIKLQQASNGRNHSLLRQVQLNSMLHRLRMLAFFRSPLPIYPHQPFHQQQQPQIAQPYDSSDLAANFGTAAVSPEVAATSDQLVMADPSSIASMGLPVSPPPLDPIRGYDWDQEALADHQLASNLSLNVLLNLDAQQQQPHHHQHLHLQESHPSQPQQQQHLQQPHPQQQSSHIQPLSAPSSASTPGLGQPELLSPTSPLSHLDHQQDKLPSPPLSSQDSASSALQPDNVSLAPCTEVAPSSDSGQSSIFPMGTNYQTNVTSQHQHQLQSANSTATPSSSTTPETVPLTTKDIMDVLSGHFPLQALRTVPNGNAGHSYQLEWQSESQPQAHLQPQLQLASTLVVDAASSPVATNVDSNNNYSDDDNNNTSTISQEPATTEFDLAGSAQPDDHAPGMNKAVVVVAQEACSESATAVVLSVQAGDHDPSIQPTVAVTASKLEHEESANVTTTSPSESSGMQADVEISDHKNSSGGSNNNHDMSMDMDIDTDMELAEASREIRLTSPPPSPSKRKRTVSGKSLWPQTEKRVTRSQLRGSTTTAVSEVMETLHVISDARGSPSSPNPRAKGSMNHTTLPSASARVMKRRRSNRGGSRQQQEEEASGSSSGASSSASSPESSPPSPKTPPPMQDHPFMAAMVDDKDPSSFRCSSDEKITEDPTSTATATTTTTTTSIAEKHPAMTMNLSDNEGNNDSDERSEASSASSRYPSRRGGVGLSTSGVSCGMSLTSAQQQQQASPPQQTASQQHRRQHGRSRSLTSTGLRDAMMVAHSLGPDGPLMAGSPGTSKVSAA